MHLSGKQEEQKKEEEVTHMQQEAIFQLLKQIEEGKMTAQEAMNDIHLQPEMLVGNYADIDMHRALRQGMPEVIYGEGKTAEQIIGIASAMEKRGVVNIMVTRLSPEKAERVAQEAAIDYDPVSRIAVANRQVGESVGKIVVLAAGTSDLPVAEEAAVTAELYGNFVERVYDVGVAGLHRLLGRLPVLEDANVVVAVAGMEGAIVSVVGGLVACPVIGVPTSVGYGANFGGAAALLSMLNSCASGVSVVNIDNGFGAGVLASKINRQSKDRRERMQEEHEEKRDS